MSGDVVERLRAAIKLAESMGVRGTHATNIYNIAAEGADLIASQAAEIEQLREERDALQAFKDFTHRRLDEAGVPTQDGEHSKAGCRIGDRMDLVAARAETAERLLAEARAALEPFAEAADALEDDHRDNSPIWETPAAMGIDAVHLRRARTLTNGGENGR